MLEPQRMDRVLIVGTKDVMEPTINALHELNMLHVEDYVAEDEYFQLGKPLKTATPLSEKLLKLRSIKSYLGTKEGTPSKEKKDKVLKELETNLGTLEETVTRKTSEKSALEASIKDLEHRSELLKPYEALGLPLDLLYGYETVTVFTGTVTDDIEPVIKGITSNYELFSAPYGKGKIIALIVPKDVAGKVSESLMKSNFVEIERLKEQGEPITIRKSIDDGIVKSKAALKAVTDDLAELNKKYAQFIVSSEELLNIDTQKAEAPLRFATSENTFVVEGWIPTDEFDRFQSTIDKAVDGSVYVTKIEPPPTPYKGEVDAALDKHIEHHEIDAPVKYNNPKILGPIESIIDAYGRPKYNEFDPTIIFALVFPLFYGFILGDVGYGLLVLIVVWLLGTKLKTPGIQVLIKVMIVCAISTMFFGLIFGEFLGFPIAEPIVNGEGGILGLVTLAPIYDHLHAISLGPIGPFSLPMERMQPGGPHNGSYMFGLKDLLTFTCIVGVVQIMLGYVLGFFNELRQHGLKAAILHKVSWASMLMGGVLAVWYVFSLALVGELGLVDPMNPMLIVGAILLVVGFIMVLIGEPLGVMEIPGLISNVLSYTRLLAVGLSSVGIAYVINLMSGMLFDMGLIGLLAGILVFLVGHTANLVLGMYAPFIQSLRLQYVEFFQKFYKSGGRIYNPFGYNRKYTED